MHFQPKDKRKFHICLQKCFYETTVAIYVQNTKFKYRQLYNHTVL